ncbi:MAG: glycosyltransferase [Gammaproteobacteria bacterium]|jgi:glycosyltransferase involved in cell wall biosynthesis|nr:glycosyltransferase [Gammaproteobacteria bacterium]
MVSVVMAAYNEAATVGRAVADVTGHPQVSEVIVVDDGSSDDTARRAADAGARVLRMGRNRGKAAALETGVAAAGSDVLLFLDADVTGLTHEAISAIVRPVVEGRVDMHVGLRARKTLWLNRLLRVFPIIGGERALSRRIWNLVPERHKRGYRIEVALNYTAKRFGVGMSFDLVTGVTHRTKEGKFGWRRGLLRRLDMIGQVIAVTWNLYIIGGIRDSLPRVRSKRIDDRSG